MTRGIERTVRQTVIDRLIDDAPGVGDTPMTFAESVAALKRSLLRDVEWLLNTRRIAEPAPDALPEVQRSVYHFGLPDITSQSADSDGAHRKLAASIEEAIGHFEPRLTNVRVQPVDAGGPGGRRVRFAIEALLRMEPNPEPVMFDTVLDSASGEFQVDAADA